MHHTPSPQKDLLHIRRSSRQDPLISTVLRYFATGLALFVVNLENELDGSFVVEVMEAGVVKLGGRLWLFFFIFLFGHWRVFLVVGLAVVVMSETCVWCLSD